MAVQKDILSEIAENTSKRITAEKKKIPLRELRNQAEKMNFNTGFPFEQAIKKDNISFICEVKKASPSKGLICGDFNPVKIAEQYENAGAAAISVLTEPDYFMGSNKYLKDIAAVVNLPILRKDFTVDEYMIYEAKTLGADAVLLICSVLKDDGELREYINITNSLGLSALVETHDGYEINRALKAGAKIIGVNNRNLKTFEVDISLSERLRSFVPDDCIFVSESGIKTRNDILELREIGTDAVLVGETLMRSTDIKAELTRLKGL